MSGVLKNRMNATEEAEKKHKKEKEKENTAVYNVEGQQVRESFIKRFRAPLISFFIVLIIIGIIYIPPVFYSEPSAENPLLLNADASAINTYQQYLKDNPEDDFDSDSLTNALENEYGTDVWSNDTDYDGVSDYAELFITDTSPVEATNVLTDYVKEIDQANGDELANPYKIDDIIMWPDSYFYKAFGSVVRTSTGYKFCNYKGWVKFPQNVYACKYKDGIHAELEHRENEDAWYIDSNDEIQLFNNELVYVYNLSLPFGINIQLSDNFAGYALDLVFPDKGGIITCYREAKMDTDESEKAYVTAPLSVPYINTSDETRFGLNTNHLTDLSNVRALIDAGQCIGVSLYDSSIGEALGIIYGYSNDSLYVADTDLNPAGEIIVSENAQRLMDSNGDISQVSWFDWYGLGFNSTAYGDRIVFLYEKEEIEESTEEISEEATDEEA